MLFKKNFASIDCPTYIQHGCPCIHNMLHYTLVITNIMFINIAMVHPHNKQNNEHHANQDYNNSTTQQMGHSTMTCESTL
jgi:hypothetical protein